MLRQIVLHTFLSGIYTMPLPSCLHLHITIALLPPPTVVQHSLQLICWPSSEAELMTGQRMVEKNYYKIVALCVCVCFCVCVWEEPCFALFQFNQHPASHAKTAYLLFTLILWKLFACEICKWNCTYINSTIRRLLTPSWVLWVTGRERVSGSSLCDSSVLSALAPPQPDT